MVRAFSAGKSAQLRLYAFSRGPTDDETRYIAVTTDFHLCHFATDAAAPAVSARCFPPTSSQLFDSVFLSRSHILARMQADGVSGDPLRSPVMANWDAELTSRASAAIDDGAVLPACRALLLRSFREERQPLLAGVARLLDSQAARLEALSHLNGAIRGVLECTASEENRTKCDIGVVTRMFDSYRFQSTRMLGSDACCSFEALRYTVQSDFAALFSRIREQGVLTANDVDVLEAVDDSLRCVQISAAGHVAHNFPAGLLPEGLL